MAFSGLAATRFSWASTMVSRRAARGGSGSALCSAPGAGVRGRVLDGEDAVQAEILHDLPVARVGANDGELALGAQAERETGQGSEKRRVHQLAAFEVDDELADPALLHFRGEVFKSGAVLKAAAAVDTNPGGRSGHADLH